MLLNTASPRKSFSVPININLQGARRRQTREIFHPSAAREQVWRLGDYGCGGERAKAQVTASSVGEDRAMLLGFTMMAFSVLMYFLVGITLVKPHLNSDWHEEASCLLVQVDVLDEWADCRGVSTAPCLKVLVNLSTSGQKARLHYDEESVLLNPECFYIPKCQVDRKVLVDEVQKILNTLEEIQGSALRCLSDPRKYPKDTILKRKYTLDLVLWSLLWPSLMLGVGALLVGLVKLNQRLAHLCTELGNEAAEGRLTTMTNTQGKLYQLLRWSGQNSPMQEDSVK
ncbi:calcium-activated potassium channel subunit beta-3 [Coregonus clupeaformis]|uniref:calcium-activated potassium channel subunit beta-3 n=1 Tax=Coregonus clupeaformis TaxID=59861 RepID=UPI001BE04D49|nr:calcium-activated potassium channel subunit beta-3 [Coregonus clupeaformis]